MYHAIYEIMQLVVEAEIPPIYKKPKAAGINEHLVSDRLIDLAAGHSVFYDAVHKVLGKYNLHLGPDRASACKCGRSWADKPSNSNWGYLHQCYEDFPCMIVDEPYILCDWIEYHHTDNIQIISPNRWDNPVYKHISVCETWSCSRTHDANRNKIDHECDIRLNICKIITDSQNPWEWAEDDDIGNATVKMLWFCSVCHDLKSIRTYVALPHMSIYTIFKYIDWEKYNYDEFADESVVTLLCSEAIPQHDISPPYSNLLRVIREDTDGYDSDY
jgi:hypothetical protein